MKHQRGVSLNGMLIGAVIFGLVSLLAMKVLPELIEYGQIKKAIAATAGDTSLKEASVAQIRAAYQKRAELENIKKVSPQDLDITKDGSDLVIAFSYSSKIALFSNVSLLFDFEGSSSQQ